MAKIKPTIKDIGELFTNMPMESNEIHVLCMMYNVYDGDIKSTAKPVLIPTPTSVETLKNICKKIEDKIITDQKYERDTAMLAAIKKLIQQTIGVNQ
jgi:hypothetical protein